VLLLDEPTNNLDPKGVQAVEQAISFLKSATSISALVVTHDINFAVTISDAVTLMKEGQIVWSGKKDDPSFLEALSEVYEISFTSIQGGNGRSVIIPQGDFL
jgi:ABC-type cobalamin/Fe3+-siderophores transport system ATPase subunit